MPGLAWMLSGRDIQQSNNPVSSFVQYIPTQLFWPLHIWAMSMVVSRDTVFMLEQVQYLRILFLISAFQERNAVNVITVNEIGDTELNAGLIL